jgi:hypothetical protein
VVGSALRWRVGSGLRGRRCRSALFQAPQMVKEALHTNQPWATKRVLVSFDHNAPDRWTKVVEASGKN